MKRPRLFVGRMKFDLEAIAAALRIDQQEVIDAFGDGRGAWPFSEYWGKSLYRFVKHLNTNTPLSDGIVALRQLGDFRISVKALSANGVKFQQSKDVGFGRTSTKEGLLASLEACDRVIVVDITQFPEVEFLPLETTRLVSAVHNGLLTVNGWKRTTVHSWMNSIYEVEAVDLVPER
jgi:hypothetical protein